MNYFASRRAGLPRAALNLTILIFCGYWCTIGLAMLLSALPLTAGIPDTAMVYGFAAFLVLLCVSIVWALVLGVAAVCLNRRSLTAWIALLFGGLEATGFVALLVNLSHIHL